MPGCGLIADCPCGFHKEDLMAGASFMTHQGNPKLPIPWQYKNIVCYQCGTLRSKVVKDVFVLVDGVYTQRTPGIGYCRMCHKRLRDITDLDLWEPKRVQEKHPDIGDPWLLCDQPETKEDGELVRYKCPKCQQFRMTIVDSGMCWD